MRFVIILFSIICSSSAAWAQKELKPTEMLKLLPDYIKGYTPAEDFKSRQMKMGTLTYTLCEKKFIHKNQSIKILLFDFSNADVMYRQALKTWNQDGAIESDSIIMRSVALDHGKGWESYRKSSGKSEISLGISNRFFLNMSGENINLTDLQSVLGLIEMAKFPK